MPSPAAEQQAARKRAMAAFARATAEELQAAIAAAGMPASVTDLRPAETGLVMLRGRTGGTGDAFNLGEAMVSRASVRLESGFDGHAYRLGADTAAARLGAIADALWQDETVRPVLDEALVAPVEQRLAAHAGTVSKQAAATRVDFFTMVRGED